MRNGHVLSHLFIASVTNEAWDLEVACVSKTGVERGLPMYSRSIHNEITEVLTDRPDPMDVGDDSTCSAPSASPTALAVPPSMRAAVPTTARPRPMFTFTKWTVSNVRLEQLQYDGGRSALETEGVPKYVFAAAQIPHVHEPRQTSVELSSGNEIRRGSTKSAPNGPIIKRSVITRDHYSSSPFDSLPPLVPCTPSPSLSPVLEGDGLVSSFSCASNSARDCHSPRPIALFKDAFLVNKADPLAHPSLSTTPPAATPVKDLLRETLEKLCENPLTSLVAPNLTDSAPPYPWGSNRERAVDRDELLHHWRTIRVDLPVAAQRDVERGHSVRIEAWADEHAEDLERIEEEEDARLLALIQSMLEDLESAIDLAVPASAEAKVNLLKPDTVRSAGPVSDERHAQQEQELDSLLATTVCKHTDGTYYIRDDPGVPVSDDQQRVREFSDAAARKTPMYRAAVRLYAMTHLVAIGILAKLRVKFFRILHFSLTIIRLRRWTFNIAHLHQVAHICPPYLYGFEYSKIRVILYSFSFFGHTKIAQSLEAILEYRFFDSALFTHFLHAGLLDPNDDKPLRLIADHSAKTIERRREAPIAKASGNPSRDPERRIYEIQQEQHRFEQRYARKWKNFAIYGANSMTKLAPAHVPKNPRQELVVGAIYQFSRGTWRYRSKAWARVCDQNGPQITGRFSPFQPKLPADRGNRRDGITSEADHSCLGIDRTRLFPYARPAGVDVAPAASFAAAGATTIPCRTQLETLPPQIIHPDPPPPQTFISENLRCSFPRLVVKLLSTCAVAFSRPRFKILNPSDLNPPSQLAG
ncbi:hypothetical protein DFH06DRAFT_1130933 [Mycena polygramma]|nr:hypothetical protein DFH06DRAFT_1130933 [Mycena polygramma]